MTDISMTDNSVSDVRADLFTGAAWYLVVKDLHSGEQITGIRCEAGQFITSCPGRDFPTVSSLTKGIQEPAFF